MLLRVVSWVRVVLAAPVVWVSPGIALLGGSGRVPSLPLAGAWWFVGSPAVAVSVSSGGRGCWW